MNTIHRGMDSPFGHMVMGAYSRWTAPVVHGPWHMAYDPWVAPWLPGAVHSLWDPYIVYCWTHRYWSGQPILSSIRTHRHG